MTKGRRRYSAEFKVKAVLAVLKGDKTAAQLAGELEVRNRELSRQIRLEAQLKALAAQGIKVENWVL